MRRFFGFLPSFLVIMTCFSANLSATDMQPSHPTTIRVGIYNNPPKVFMDHDGRVVGIFPDLLAYVAQEEGWRLEFVHGNWQECLNRLDNGAIDIMVDVAYSDVRLGHYTFNGETVLLNWGEIFTRPDITVGSFLDLKDRIVAVMKGSIHTDGERGIKALLKQFDIACAYTEVESYKEVLDLLREGRADAGVVNRLYGALEESARGVNRSPIVFNPSQLRFASPKQSNLAPYLLERIDFHLRELKADQDSMYHQVVAHYLSGMPGGFRIGEKRAGLQLDPGEQAWIREHPEIRVGVDPGFAPFEFLSESGVHSGIAADYLESIGRALGLRFRVVDSPSWDETMDKARKGEIDLLSCVGISEDRKRYFFYSRPYLAFPRVIITRTESTVQSLEDLAGKRVGVQTNSSHHDFLSEKAPQLKPVFHSSFQEALMALSRRETDAVIGNLAVATDTIRKLNLTNLAIAGHTSEGTSPLAFAVRKDWPMLVRLLNKALAAMPEEKRMQIAQRWLPGQVSHGSSDGARARDLPLTDREKAFLLEHPVIRVAIDPSYPPFEWFDKEDRHQGITSEYLRLIEARLGVTLEVQQALTWTQVLEGARNRSIDLVACISETPSRKLFLNFTQPYLTFPIVIFTRDDSSFVSGLDDLHGRKVSVVHGYAPQEFIARNHPAIQLSLVDSPLMALQQVSTGVSSACVENLAVCTYLMQHHQITNLKVAAPADMAGSTRFSMGVRNDWPLLTSILDKALNSITPPERNAIAGKWLTVRFEHAADWSRMVRYAAGFTGVALVVFGVFFYWNRRLAREISVRRRVETELEAARDEAEEASRAKSRFLANMSHEIRTPMNAILGYSQLMQKDKALSAEQRDNLATIRHSGEHLLNLINDILEMSKIEAGRMEVNASAFDLFTLLGEVHGLFRERAVAKGLALRFDHDASVPGQVFADEKKLRQVLINLLGNAVKFTDHGEVSLHVGAEPGASERALAAGDPVVLTFQVEDTGAGIPEAEYDAIFQHFEQTEIGRSKEGSGLGLAICRRYLELMGGEIGVTSKLGEGSRFTFTLPVTIARAAEVPRAAPARRVIGLNETSAPCRVLVVDDKSTNRQLLARILDRAGFSVLEASDGMQALEVFETWRPQVVMMDIRMPVLDGVEATRRIKASAAGEKTVVIAVSASAMEEQRVGVLARGADAFIRKPFKEDEVFDAIRTHLGIEYLYEGDLPGAEAPPSAPLPPPANTLPEDLIQRIRTAAEGGYIERLNACIEEVTPLDAPLARHLRALADDYQYEELVARLEVREKDVTNVSDAPEKDRPDDSTDPFPGLTKNDSPQ